MKLIAFLIFIEALLLIAGFIRIILVLPIAPIMALLNKSDTTINIFNILLEIPVMVLLLLTVSQLNIETNSDKYYKTVYFFLAIIIIFISRVLYQKDIYNLAQKDEDNKLSNFAGKYFKYSSIFYLLFFILFTLEIVPCKNFFSSFLIEDIYWLFNLKTIGIVIKIIGGLILIGTFSIGINAFNFFYFKNKT